MKSGEARSFDFPAYLEAKIAIDSASLNPSLYGRFRDHLRQTVDPRVLDLGTGTGAMLRRIIELGLSGQVELIGLDRDEQNLIAGTKPIEQALIDQGYKTAENQERPGLITIRAERGGNEVRVELRQADILDMPSTGMLEPFDCITAHAFMDLMPLDSVVALVRPMLKAEGVFYSTLNYDGTTVLLPEYADAGFERRLLRIYNRSMEQRRKRGRRTGGCLSGRRLYRALQDAGFAILGMGSSDWNVFPSGGALAEEQKLFLTAILSMIEGEARRFRTGSGAGKAAGAGPIIDPQRLADWYADRLEAVQKDNLSLIVHQIDLLARTA